MQWIFSIASTTLMMKLCTNIVVVLLVVFFSTSNIFAQFKTSSAHHKSLSHLRLLTQTKNIEDRDKLNDEINYPVLGGITLGYAYAIYQINNYYKNTWWKADTNYTYDGLFHVVNDWSYALWLDKFGHMFGTSATAHFFSAGSKAANVDDELSTWLGAAGGLGMQLYVEIQDGFAPTDKITREPKWGFSPGDAVADILGASYFIARYYYPYLNNFQIRVSYYPSEAMLNGKKSDHNISDDYDGQKMWLAFRMKNLLPKSLANHWPSFLMLAAGYGVTGIGDNANRNGVVPSYYLAFDIDAEEIPLHGKFWEFLKESLNYVHFPMPGIKFSQDGVQFLLIAY